MSNESFQWIRTLVQVLPINLFILFVNKKLVGVYRFKVSFLININQYLESLPMIAVYAFSGSS